MEDELSSILSDLPAPDQGAMTKVRERASQVLRPSGALARLDEIAIWLAGWQRSERPAVERPALVVFVADHGVAAEGVSAYPADVTKEMLSALREGAATASVMARVLGVELIVVDVGVGRPSGNLLREPALDIYRFRECLDSGRRAVASLGDPDLLVFGEMGIANTTPAAAVCAALFGGGAESWTGRGTGIDDRSLVRKISVVNKACERIGMGVAPGEILRQVGGGELVAIAGAVAEARLRSIPVILDGYVVTAAAPLEMARPGALDHAIAGHCSGEPGHRLLLERLGKAPILDLGLRLGEGSGALAALPLVKLATACVTDVATFQEWGVSQ